jgi:hypothetical protein
MQNEENPTYSAADALKQAENHNTPPEAENEPPETEGQKPEVEEEEEVPEPEDDETERDEPDNGAPDEDDDQALQLDPLLEELAQGNPKAEKRVQEIAKGLQKLKTETRQLRDDLKATKPKADNWDTYEQALANPDTAGKTLEQLVLAVAQHHKTSPDSLIGALLGNHNALLPEVDENGRKRTDWERRGFASEKEMHMDAELKQLKSFVQEFQQDREQLKKERESAAKQAEFKTYVDEVAPKTIRKLEKLEAGWKVSKAMVERAIREFPQLKEDPARAVKAMYPDELKAHHSKISAAARPQRGPEMLPETKGKGISLPEPSRFSAADALRLVES